MNIRAEENHFVVVVAQFGTALGSRSFLAAILAVTAASLAWSKRYSAALILPLMAVCGHVLVHVQKQTLDLVRPDQPLWLIDADTPSFPSGHAADAMIVYLWCALLIANLGVCRRGIIYAAVLLIILVGASRPVLGVHWPSDVIAGWSFGLAWVALWCLFLHFILERRAFRGSS